MDVHPTKNVSIGIDPYPNGVNVAKGLKPSNVKLAPGVELVPDVLKE
jgi:hypothetical protein